MPLGQVCFSRRALLNSADSLPCGENHEGEEKDPVFAHSMRRRSIPGSRLRKVRRPEPERDQFADRVALDD